MTWCTKVKLIFKLSKDRDFFRRATYDSTYESDDVYVPRKPSITVESDEDLDVWTDESDCGEEEQSTQGN